jgi:glycosyltransferase involved in cell wall biosynthesis
MHFAIRAAAGAACRGGVVRIGENPMMAQPTLSVIIAARNEAHQIADCVRSVAFADEVIVLDSNSTDGTADAARAAGATVHVTDWPGYGRQQQRGISLATGDWVLSLDADERISEELAREIGAAIAQPSADGYRLPRHSSFCGQFMDHCGWRPDYTLRLVKRERAGFTDHFLHAHMTVDGRRADLRSPIIHYSYRDLDDVLEKLSRYSRGAAIDARDHGQRGSLARALASGFWAFLRTYLLRQGFRDGRMGFVLALYNAQTSYYKYLRLWMMQRQA